MDLEETLSVLNEMQQAGVVEAYAITGAVAALYYIEPTVTLDPDVFVTFGHPDTRSGLLSLEPIFSFLLKRGYSAFRSEGIEIGSWPVQFLPVSSDLDADALAVAADITPVGSEVGRSPRVCCALSTLSP